jgi:hypothetical protein
MKIIESIQNDTDMRRHFQGRNTVVEHGTEREREREREESWGVVRDTTVLEGDVIEIEISFGSLEGSQAVPASPSGKGVACIGDLFNFDFKDIGAAVVGEIEGYIIAKNFKKLIFGRLHE